MSTIYIKEQDVSFQIQHHYLKVFHQQTQRICIPIRNLSQFVIFGNISLPKEVIKLVTSHQIPVLYLTQTGEYLGRLENPSQAQAKYLSYQRRRARDTEFNRATADGNGNGKNHSHKLMQKFLQHWEGKLRTFVLHPYIGEVTFRQCLDLQVREYLACLLGNVEYYRPLALKHHPAHSNLTSVTEVQKTRLTLVK